MAKIHLNISHFISPETNVTEEINMKLGYICISLIDQNFPRQDLSQVDKIFQDTKSGSTADRVELQKLIEFARPGDMVICFSIDRLARHLSDLQNIVPTLNDKGGSVHFLS